MSKGLFIVFGLVTASVLLLTLKVFTVVYTPLPKAERKVEKKDDLAQLFDNLMEEENGNALRIYWTDSMEKLVKLGESVVPDLIEAIETAYHRALSIKYEGRSEWRINYDTEMLQVRAAMILGKISDRRAIPALMKLQCTDSRLICDYVDEAIRSIQENGKEPGVGR